MAEREITLKLLDDANLDLLLAGQWACFFWLADNGDGTYGIHAGGLPAEPFPEVGGGVPPRDLRAGVQGRRGGHVASADRPGGAVARGRGMDGGAPRPSRLEGARVMRPGTSLAQCSLHLTHVPMPTYTELHHVIPQAWQVVWQPAQPWPLAGPSPDRPHVTLWDARTLPLCRTGHGNVHHWLVALMHEIDQLAHASGTAAGPLLTKRAAAAVGREARAAHRPIVRAELAVSLQAIQRYTDAGGPLALLIAKRQWGEI